MLFTGCAHWRTKSIWAETTEKWDEVHPSWKTVGESPERVPRHRYQQLLSDFAGSATSIEDIFLSKKILYRVRFRSGREELCCSRAEYATGDHVIVEADRGEDCAMIEAVVDRDASGSTLLYNTTPKGGQIHKSILRRATEADVKVLDMQRAQEKKALETCIALVKAKGFQMEILRCEFQWDMRKITFYFRSGKRIDFRELVRELFKFFKIRIWMSMENRGK